MVVNILKAKASSKSVISYNEKKVEAGNASVIACRNLPGDNRFAIEYTFKQFEQNDRIVAQARTKSFHMAVNPGPADTITEGQTIVMIDTIMKSLGYEKQPYVIYRHNDIERAHYHVVSTRFDADGKRINNSFEAIQINKLLKQLGPTMGFELGIPAEQKKRGLIPDNSQTPRFRVNETNVINKLASLYLRALEYPVASLYDMQAVLWGMNVRMTLRKNLSGGYNVLLRGLDKNKKPVTKYVSLERQVKLGAHKLLIEKIAQHKPYTTAQMVGHAKLRTKVQFCIEHSRSAEEFLLMTNQLDLFCAFERNKAGKIEKVVATDLKEDAIATTEPDRGLILRGFQEAEETGYWKKREEKIRALTKAEIDEAMELAEETALDYGFIAEDTGEDMSIE